MPTPRTYFSPKTPPHISTLILAAALGAISMNMFLPSMPAMTEHFGTTSAVMQLAVSGYLGATSALQLVAGPLSDRFGRRAVMLSCFAIFLVGTVVCLFASSIEILLLGRVVQAFSAGGLVLSRAIVRDLVEPNKAASMIGYVTMGMTLGPMLAPIAGGVLDELYGWQAVFWAKIVIGLVVLFVVYFDLGETNAHQSSSFGAQFRQYPELLTSRRFWGYVATMAFSSGAFFAFLGGGPFVSSDIYSLSPSTFGLYFFFVSIGYMTGNFISGRKSEAVGILPMLFIGGTLTCVGLGIGMVLIAMGVDHPLVFFAPMIFVGIGNGMVLPNATAGIVSVRPHLAGSASGLGGSIQIGGGALISAMAGTLVAKYPSPMTVMTVMQISSMIGILSAFYIVYVNHLVKREGSETQGQD